MRGRFVFALIAAAMSMACASSGSGAAGGSRKSAGGQDVITEADIAGRAADAANALQIIQKLRPQMLRNRGLAVLPTAGRSAEEATAASLPRVYIDNIAYGDLGQLSNVNASQVREIRYINARDATTQWGTGHMGGVILVLTKK
jgi:hypothetical protein